MLRHFATIKQGPRVVWGISLFIIGLASWLGFSTSHDPAIDVKPDDNRFTKTVLTEKLNEPMELTFLPGSKVLFIERKGAVKIYDPKTAQVTTIATIPVNTTYINKKDRKEKRRKD